MAVTKIIFYVLLAFLGSILLKRVDASDENFRPMNPPLGTKEEWMEGIEKGDLYERLRLKLFKKIADKRYDNGNENYISAKELAKRPVKKSEVLDVMKQIRLDFLEKKHEGFSEKDMIDTLKLIDDGIAEIEKLPDTIRPKLFRKVIKKIYKRLAKIVGPIGEDLGFYLFCLAQLLKFLGSSIGKAFYIFGRDAYYNIAAILHNFRQGKRKPLA